ncbi:MAG: T9SS type A sorting domain-containing protein, partial [Bacteroidales bacterium]|nr:T9SS type A sorting domain-containing protein [Candidatus Physcocola equi]
PADAIIPAGNHEIKVVYNDPVNGKTDEVTFPVVVNKKPVTISGGASKPKVYDGNTNATLAELGTIEGVLPGDEVAIDADNTSAKFDTPEVGTGKDVNVDYAINGKDADNYEISGNPVKLTDGVITKADRDKPVVADGTTNEPIDGLTPEMEISIDGGKTWETAEPEVILPEGEYLVRYAETDTTKPSLPAPFIVSSGVINMVKGEAFIVNINGYCPESEGEVQFEILAGDPVEYRAVITGLSEEELKNVSFKAIDENNTFRVYIPMCDAGEYNVEVQFKNTKGSVSPVYNFKINVNLSEKYIHNVWEDVVSIVNKNTPDLNSKDFEKRFTAFQWYRNGVEIPGATMPYYNEKGGLNGVYYAKVVTTDNRKLRTCTREWHFDYGLKLDVYPNPVVDNVNLTLSADNGKAHEVRIVNMTGNEVYRGSFKGTTTTINCRNFVKGWYVITVDNKEAKIIKE